jgi:CHAT domain-containing protein/tetratricopeptide (TPR) repeat protein
MKDIKKLIHKINQHVERRNWQSALKAGKALWDLPYEGQMMDPKFRTQYADAIKKVAEIYTFIDKDIFSGAQAFKRLYEVADEHLGSAKRASDKEYAAYRLGSIYETAKLPHNAVFWFKKTLELGRINNKGEILLFNLTSVAQSYETLGELEQARIYYDEILNFADKLKSLENHVNALVPAAMFQIQYSDSAKGETLFQSLAQTLFESIQQPLPAWFIPALYALGVHYLKTQRPTDAVQLAQMVIERAARFEDAENVHSLFYGLIARAHLHTVRFDEALKVLASVHPVDSLEMINGGSSWIDILELWADIARIHILKEDYPRAIAAYETLAYNLGARVIDPRYADTSRKRVYFLQQQTIAVHEMVSVWLDIKAEKIRDRFEARVANAILQLKANLFLSMEVNRLDVFQQYEGLDLMYFEANRRYATSVYRALNHPANDASMRELEQDLFRREQLEQRMNTGDMLPVPGVSRMVSFDFRESAEIGDHVLLDYSLVDYRPPINGLAGPAQGRRYIGVRLEKDVLKIVDLGDTAKIESLCSDLIRYVSNPPSQSAVESDRNQARHLRPVEVSIMNDLGNIEKLSANVYERIIAPFESVGTSLSKRSLIISPDGILASLPFQALLLNGRYLIEEQDIVYCHSLLQRESLSRRQLSPGRRMVPSISRNAILVGDADYGNTEFRHLPGTKQEITQVGDLLARHTIRDTHLFEEVKLLTGGGATVSKLIESRFPKIVHIAAHGTFSEAKLEHKSGTESGLGSGYRRWDEMAAWPLSELDLALLRPMLVLSKDTSSPSLSKREGIDLSELPLEGRMLSALELSSLNLIGSLLVVLSACETGLGVTQPGAGILGFQYALTATCARAGMVSLWKVLDRETSEFMVDFYRTFLDQRNAKAGYLKTIRKHCRHNDERVHPYYWAAFSFLDLNYYYPVF